MDLKEFGRLLKEERLRQGLEIADVMEKTKISRMNLVAIEEGNEQALPHPVYAKGFVKNYARFLGMDADKMGNTLAQIYVSQEELDSDNLESADAEKLPSAREGLPKFLGLAAVLVVLLVFILGIWVFQGGIFGLFSGSTAEEVVLPPSVTGQPGEESDLGHGPQDDALMRELGALPGSEPGTLAFPSLAEEPESETLEDDGLPELQSSALDAPVEDVAPPVQDVPDTGGEPGLEEAEMAPPLPVAEQPAVVPPGTERSLEIRATENCWLSAQADEMRPREVFLRPGERFEISFQNSVELRLGNAGGVSLYLDGQQWPLSARSGEVMTLRLP